MAAIHTAAPDNMKVLIVTDEQVFNEFGSGCADVNAMRRMLKNVLRPRKSHSLRHYSQIRPAHGRRHP
ncbi:hypothetical protein [Duncaniella muris]|uniref:hypothetical protein n=1 Tax=Duncaniella muris TaxID=2094150 RepID=UPI003F662D2F